MNLRSGRLDKAIRAGLLRKSLSNRWCASCSALKSLIRPKIHSSSFHRPDQTRVSTGIQVPSLLATGNGQLSRSPRNMA